MLVCSIMGIFGMEMNMESKKYLVIEIQNGMLIKVKFVEELGLIPYI